MLNQKLMQKIHDRILLENTPRCQAEPLIDNYGNLYQVAELLQNQPLSVLLEDKKLKNKKLETKKANSHNELYKPQTCYICKKKFNKLHHFYHKLCESCGEKNYHYRQQTADLTGRIALVTGGRIKIGFEIALKLLRAGATVLVTTRFVQDAIYRYQQQHDLNQWKERLHIYGLDLKYIPSVEEFCQFLQQNYPSLDIIINNATQTLQKTEVFYQYRAKKEQALFAIQQDKQSLLANFADTALTAELSQHLQNSTKNSLHYDNSQNAIVVKNSLALDEFNEPIDFSEKNSWVKKLDEIDSLEFIEAQLINATAPFILNARLKSLLKKSPFTDKFIINVSAMEGQFNRENKTCNHPHTNMAKASLNMMTRTSAQDYATDNIFMNSVDTGWVTQENPFYSKQQSRINGMVPPLDCIDGASRVLAPIFDTINNNTPAQFGYFLKDYQVCEW